MINFTFDEPDEMLICTMCDVETTELEMKAHLLEDHNLSMTQMEREMGILNERFEPARDEWGKGD